MRRASARAAVAVFVALLTGCSSSGGSPAAPDGADARTGSAGTTPSGSPGSTDTPRSTAGVPPAPVEPTGEVTELADGLDAPWSVVPLPDGRALVSERDSGRVLEIDAAEGAGSATRTVGVVPGVEHAGEAGLLGLALSPDEAQLYAYLTTASDNRIVRMPLGRRSDGSLALGDPEIVLDGLAKAFNHDGGRIAFGPDGMLYATVGDAGRSERAQDPDSLNGKILRMTPAGDVPADNPFPGSLVYSLGHRNPQGIAWDATGQLFAAEFGQDTWDEFNRIEPGANYGWPEVEGAGGEPGFTDPLAQWPTDEASPSGLAYLSGTFFLAGLGGERLWVLTPNGDGVDDDARFVGDFGRIRDVVAAADGSLWMLTNNTDGRGTPRPGDDRLLAVEVGRAD